VRSRYEGQHHVRQQVGSSAILDGRIFDPSANADGTDCMLMRMALTACRSVRLQTHQQLFCVLVPAPGGLLSLQVNTAQPGVDSIRDDEVCFSGEYRLPVSGEFE